jgi:hypothetical protein
MEQEEAQQCQDSLGIQNKRRSILRIADGRKFVAKNTWCPKVNFKQRNPVWLVNEIVYWEFAQVAKLKVPCAKLLIHDDEYYFGSEFVTSRIRVSGSSALNNLFNGENKVQLVRALLLDLALLNSDRQLWNILVDAERNLWFIDHDKSLWGDGREPPGDLGRISPCTLSLKLSDYVGDYLASQEANNLIWNKKIWPLVLQKLEALPLEITILQNARDKVPTDWMSSELWRRMEDFLPLWWDNLHCFFERCDALDRIVNILQNRGLICWQVPSLH